MNLSCTVFSRSCNLAHATGLSRDIFLTLYCLSQVVKKLWLYIREKNLQNPKNKRKILCDEALHGIFRVRSIDMFQMNKALSKHIWPLDEAEGIVYAVNSYMVLQYAVKPL